MPVCLIALHQTEQFLTFWVGGESLNDINHSEVMVVWTSSCVYVCRNLQQ